MHDGAADSSPDGDLPAALTSFIGRESQIADLVSRLSRRRVLTLVGAGGVGKSRLALAVAGRVLAANHVGVTFVELAGLGDADLVPEVVAMKLGVHARTGQRTIDALIEFLGRRSELLVLDNCEHLHDACATLASVVLRTCADVQILATSRRALRLEGEVVWRVPPLTMPDDAVRGLVAEFEEYEAIRLFIERARALVPDFVLTESNATAVADICRQLDGMPLAIELAAARLSVLSPQQLHRRLLDRFQLLTTGCSPDPRHRTLRAAVDWSHDSLEDAPRVLLRRLAVFAGGFSLEAAESACADAASPGRVDACNVIDLLDQLVDQSLVIAEHPPGGTEVRYRLLETVREYAADKLADAGEAAIMRDRHTTWCLSVASPRTLGQLVDSAAVARVGPELDNMRAALRWCLTGGQPAHGLRLGIALGAFWFAGGYHSEGSRWLTQLLDMPQNQAPTLERAVALAHLGLFANLQGQLDSSRVPLEESLALAEQLGEPGVALKALHFLGGLAVTTRHFPTARRNYERAIALNRGLLAERRPMLIAGLTALGRLALIEGDIPGAIKHADEALVLARTLNEPFSVARALSLRGWIAAHQRDDQMARRYFTEALTLARESGLPQLIGNLLVQEAWLDLRAGSTADARNRLIEALLLWHRMGAPEMLVYALQGLAGVSASVDPLRAARLAGAASGVEKRLQAAPVVIPGAVDPQLAERWVAAAHRSLGDTVFGRAWADGDSLTDDQALEYGLETPAPETSAVFRLHARGPASTPLTSREEQIARLIRGGLDNRMIAQELVISRATAERHVSNILHKLGFSSRAEVAAWAATHLE